MEYSQTLYCKVYMRKDWTNTHYILCWKKSQIQKISNPRLNGFRIISKGLNGFFIDTTAVLTTYRGKTIFHKMNEVNSYYWPYRHFDKRPRKNPSEKKTSVKWDPRKYFQFIWKHSKYFLYIVFLWGLTVHVFKVTASSFQKRSTGRTFEKNVVQFQKHCNLCDEYICSQKKYTIETM